MSHETIELARFVAELTPAAVPAEVSQRACRLALDLAGSIVRAAREAESTPSLFAAIEALGL